ncbi:MAG: DUF2092 domain-containing protein, partial [Verrucomicrobia bacterium]|nr:DUF2092 domain-containing protein [Verrucomicrobiota bacterium]
MNTHRTHLLSRIPGTSALLAATCGMLFLLPAASTHAAPPTPGGELSGDVILKQMSEKLGAAKQFSFKAHRTIEPDMAGGDGLAGMADITVVVRRPDKMTATATLPGDIRRFYFDGAHFSLVDEGKYVYSTVPLAVSLDELPAELARIYGFTPPLAEFLVSDLYQDLTWRAAKV